MTTYPHELKDSVVDARAMRKPEATTRTELIEEEQFLLLHLASAKCKLKETLI